MDSLRLNLESEGLKDVVYMVVNHQGEQAQRLHSMMAQRLSENITLYKQDEQQPDVWQALNGDKDDFLIYDRCGRLTKQISLPYSIIGHGHIAGAIKDTYCKRLCGECMYESAEIPEECKEKADAQPDTDGAPPVNHDTGHDHNHDHGHGQHHGHHHHHHGHGHGSGQHGDHHDFHPRGFGHGHNHNHGHHHGSHDVAGSDHGQSHSQQGFQQQAHHHGTWPHGQHGVDLGQMQQADTGQVMTQGAHGEAGTPWAAEKMRWKSKYSWQWTAGSDNEASPKTSWCWHWRRLFGEAESEQPVGLWHCDEALPASWQWHGLTGNVANNVRETWQWRSPSAAWQQPQTAQWAWPLGVASWGWEQL